MALFDSLNKMAKNLGEMAEGAVENGKLNIKIMEEKTKLNEAYLQLGETVYQQAKTGEDKSVEINNLLIRIDDHHAAIAAAQAPAPQPASAYAPQAPAAPAMQPASEPVYEAPEEVPAAEEAPVPAPEPAAEAVAMDVPTEEPAEEPVPVMEVIPEPDPAPAEPAPAPAAPAGPKFCGGCGSRLDPGARFCGNCGSPVA